MQTVEVVKVEIGGMFIEGEDYKMSKRPNNKHFSPPINI